MLQAHHVDAIQSHAPTVTYAATGSAVVLWGLHASDIAVIMSSFASVCGVLLQVYLAIHRIRRLERMSDANVKVTSALAQSQRALDHKVETQSDDGQKTKL